MKFLVLSLLVVACSAVPYNSYSSGSYSSGGYASPSVAKYSSFGGYSNAGAPRIALLLTGGLGGAGYSGISSGLTGGYGFGNGYSGYSGYSGAAAPAYQIVQAAAPAVQTVALQAAPVATVAIAAQPSYQAVSSYGAGYQQRQQTVSNFAGLAQHRSDNFESVVPAAIQQTARTVEYRQIANQEQPIQAQVVEVEPSDNPVHLHFKTRSSTLSVSQAHTPAQPVEVKSESAQDEPQRLSIEVQKPVIQNVREVITPYRQVEQEILPVQESLHTIVAKGEQRQQYHNQQQVNYGAHQQTYSAVQAAPVATVQAVQPVQTIALQAAPAVQTVAVQPVHVEAAPAVAHYQSANYVQAAPAVTTLAISQPSASATHFSTGNNYQTGSQYGARFHSTAPVSTSSYSSSSSSSSYKPVVSKFQKDGY